MIGAVLLAAGRSTRMGRPKQILPWGDTTIAGHIIRVLESAGVKEIVVVTGAAREAVEGALVGTGVRLAHSPDFEVGELLSSIQTGLRALPEDCEAALIALGDQPQIQPEVIRAVIEGHRETRAPIVVPSYQMRRGHPVLVARSLWPDLLSLSPPASLRDFLSAERPIHYVVVSTPTILGDMDTPEDYERLISRP